MDWEKDMICPLCKSQKTGTYLSSSLKRTIIHMISGSAEVKPTTIKVCHNCQNAWTDPYPQPIDYTKSDFHHSSLCGSAEVEKLTTLNDLPQQWSNGIIMQANLIKRNLKPKTKILEIGCGEGILLNELAKLQFTVKGIEPSETASLRAEKKGIDCVQGYFPHPSIKESFDLVILSHVLEHIEKPLEFITQIKSILNPGGYLLLVQTNYKSLQAMLLKWGWYWGCSEHYWHFTPKGLVNITRPLNFNVKECEFSSLVHEDNYITKLTEKLKIIIPSIEDQFHLLLQLSD